MAKTNLRTRIKLFFELGFWKWAKSREGDLTNHHYRYFFTDYFSIPPDHYAGKKILDIGCGPRGSLEWADMAEERTGIDPLADQYLKMGASGHKMKYITGTAENLPFENEYFDVVSSFNSLDHVIDPSLVCNEIRRVLKTNGLFILIVDIHHLPTLTEPLTLTWDFIEKYLPGFSIMEKRQVKAVHRGRIYQNLRENIPVSHTSASRGVLAALLKKDL